MTDKRYAIEFLPSALRELGNVPPDARQDVVEAIDALSADPRPEGVTLLGGTGKVRVWRITVGNYRVLFQARDDVLVVLIVRVADRREVYRQTEIKRLLKRIRAARR